VRNRYFAASSTYLRARWLLDVVIVPLMTFASLESGVLRWQSLFLLVAANGLFGAHIALHLREIIGSPRGRLTPRTNSAHFVVAFGWMTAFSVVLPLCCSLVQLGTFGPHLTVVATALASFAFGCVAAATPGGPWSSLGFVGFVLIQRFGFDSSVSLSNVELLLLLTGATTLLACAALRISKHDVDATQSFENRLLRRAGRITALAGYWAWIVKQKCGTALGRSTLQGESGTTFGAERAAYLRRLANRSHPKLRTLGGSMPGPGEGLWRRARHWNAGWRFAWRPVTFGAVAGGYLLWSALAASNARSLAWLWTIPFLPLAVLVPGSLVSQRQTRGRLAIEYLRPFSRTQLVQAVALTVAGSMTLFVALAVSIPLVGLWIQGGPWPNRQIVWFLIAAVAWLPLFLAAGTANVASFDSTMNVGFCLFFYALYILVLFGDGDRPGGWLFAWFSALIFTVGLWALIVAYRSWLNNDIG
jgi:hypothetical protein